MKEMQRERSKEETVKDQEAMKSGPRPEIHLHYWSPAEKSRSSSGSKVRPGWSGRERKGGQ